MQYECYASITFGGNVVKHEQLRKLIADRRLNNVPLISLLASDSSLWSIRLYITFVIVASTSSLIYPTRVITSNLNIGHSSQFTGITQPSDRSKIGTRPPQWVTMEEGEHWYG